ncbi:MAG: nucleotidyltransferase domain-containing protein [Desulfuromusa sp.]|nr:nucleotidyltransferase domain-containing protein [Desulfuromusa sp.]
MRLTEKEITVIVESVHDLDCQAQVYLFGSRVDDAKRGGDIDLLIMSQSLSPDAAGKIRWSIWEQLGEQKIDILIARDTTDPFVRIALREGVVL